MAWFELLRLAVVTVDARYSFTSPLHLMGFYTNLEHAAHLAQPLLAQIQLNSFGNAQKMLNADDPVVLNLFRTLVGGTVAPQSAH